MYYLILFMYLLMHLIKISYSLCLEIFVFLLNIYFISLYPIYKHYYTDNTKVIYFDTSLEG